jgi:hypothetical protein
VLYSIVVILWILSKILLANIAGSKKYLTFDSETSTGDVIGGPFGATGPLAWGLGATR